MNNEHTSSETSGATSAPAVDPRHAEIFESGKTFADLGLRSSVVKGVDAAGFKHPTSIQASLIPVALTGKDVLGQAKTGTGKTAAFGLPLLHMCGKDEPYQALVLAPTRELAIQITEEINELGKFTPIRAMTVYGGERVSAQAQKLKKGAQIVVATPGRVMDMVERGHLHFNNVRFAVLDEVDRMLDIGFREDIRRILEKCPPAVPSPDRDFRRQTIFVSATISSDIDKLARRYMHEPEKIVVAAGSLTVSLVDQHYLAVNPWDKRRLLVHLLTHEEPALTVVFCRLKRTVDELTRLLNEKGIEAHAIHGDMSQGKRNRTMSKLRSGHLSVLVASDLASRGIDVDDISHVINYDLPEDVELYVHRIGRTARAGRRGVAWALVTPDQGPLLTQIEQLINVEIPKLDYADFVASPPPQDWRGEIPKVRTGIPADAPTEPAPPSARLVAASNPTLPQKVDEAKFPGGVVPTKLPPRRMMGKIPGRGR
jgi:ATP-dependent RNA helicase DeaD